MNVTLVKKGKSNIKNFGTKVIMLLIATIIINIENYFEKLFLHYHLVILFLWPKLRKKVI